MYLIITDIEKFTFCEERSHMGLEEHEGNKNYITFGSYFIITLSVCNVYIFNELVNGI